MDAQAQNIVNSLQQLAERCTVLTVKPFEGYGQDPSEWLYDSSMQPDCMS
jgi:hypothetical protein